MKTDQPRRVAKPKLARGCHRFFGTRGLSPTEASLTLLKASQEPL
ncbi:MAG: hypothetical protein ACXVZM_00610 [Terriglobales bacterium]